MSSMLLPIRLIIIVLASALCFTSANHHQLSRTIRPNTDEHTQQQAAMSVIRRLIADKADNVAIRINFNLPGNYFKVRTFRYPVTKGWKPMHKFSFIMKLLFSHFVDPQDKQLRCASNRGVERCVGL